MTRACTLLLVAVALGCDGGSAGAAASGAGAGAAGSAGMAAGGAAGTSGGAGAGAAAGSPAGGGAAGAAGSAGGSGGAAGAAGAAVGGSSGVGGAAGASGGAAGAAGGSGWPAQNAWSWNGSWTPSPGDFPLPGLLDDEYFDAHPDGAGDPTPILPPGAWDWSNPDDDLANWRNFASSIGSFARLLDAQGHHYGWRLDANAPAAVDYAGAAAYFEGSSGPDLLDLGPGGSVHSFGSGQLGEGPDVLVFDASWSLDLRTGSDVSGGARDDDLVVAGCGTNPDGSFDVETSSLHTGPGRDWVFVRDISRAAVDLGNGAEGRTDTVDPLDGDDLVVIRGNAHDFRVFGGRGDDVAVWFVDEVVQTTTWLGPNFFGSAGLGAAAWDDTGTDRLVLAVPPSTPIVSQTPTPDGSLLVRATDGVVVEDAPTAGDPFAYYCIECGTGPGGRRTLILEYNSASGAVHTGYFFVTAFEQLQIGAGADAVLYRLDDVAGAAVAAPDLEPFVPPELPASYCQ